VSLLTHAQAAGASRSSLLRVANLEASRLAADCSVAVGYVRWPQRRWRPPSRPRSTPGARCTVVGLTGCGCGRSICGARCTQTPARRSLSGIGLPGTSVWPTVRLTTTVRAPRRESAILAPRGEATPGHRAGPERQRSRPPRAPSARPPRSGLLAAAYSGSAGAQLVFAGGSVVTATPRSPPTRRRLEPRLAGPGGLCQVRVVILQ
jgi:hypothetical protein